ncbi:hypothetical protein V6Z12_D10G143600 [Gossypium hirsutum]
MLRIDGLCKKMGYKDAKLLMLCGYNFNKVARYKQLTLEEAKEKMKNKRKTADDCERWMMKAANNSAAAFGEVEKIDEK